jgi:hypothetical protein
MAMGSVLELPVTANPMRLLGTPGKVAGAKLTVPSNAEVAVEACDASSAG